MCGIAGWAYLDARTPPSYGALETLRTMCDRLKHRGPDSEGMMIGTGAALGVRRLAVIDPITGEQPAYGEDGEVVVVFNGEIYNYRELREDLRKRGHVFRSSSDTEVLPHLYEEHGIEMLAHLNGMFAFALWDKERRRLMLARDRFGEKPLYWGVFNGALLFASEPKALLTHSEVQTGLNLQALRYYLSLDYVPAPHSIFTNINKLPAAHALTLQDGEVTVWRYWNPSYEKLNPAPSEEEAARRVEELIEESVRSRLVSDVPLGVLLSGGMDSSTVAALAVRASAATVKTFSISFAEKSFDESAYARGVADFLGTDHHEERLSADLAADLVCEIGAWMDEPISDPSLVPTYLLARFTRKHVTVALGGDGGDEIFAGYPMYRAHALAELYLRVLPPSLRRALIERCVRLLPVKTKNLSLDFRAKRFILGTEYADTVARHHVWFGSFAPHHQELLLTPEVRDKTSADVYSEARELLESCDATTTLERMQYLDTKLYLAGDILTKVDRASMAVSLEVRAPFLDHRIAEYVAKLPANYKLRGRGSKYILKRAMRNTLPGFVARRGKKGFGAPAAEWLKRRLRSQAHDLLSSDRMRRGGLFDPSYVAQLLDEHERGRANHFKPLWTLFMFELWRESFAGHLKSSEDSLLLRQEEVSTLR